MTNSKTDVPTTEIGKILLFVNNSQPVPMDFFWGMGAGLVEVWKNFRLSSLKAVDNLRAQL